MRYKLNFHPQAAVELEEAFDWYETRSTGLGRRFVEAVDNALSRLSAQPFVHAKIIGDYREMLIDKFPYLRIYEVLERDEIIFISHVFHTRKNPEIKYLR